MQNRATEDSRVNRLKALLTARKAVPAPGCHDPLGAMLIEQAGFEAVSLSGYSVAASQGKPDIGLLTGTQMAGHAAAIAETISVPVIADADTGYGGISNVADTVRAYERSGVAALHLEDQVNPKRCGAMSSKQLASDEEMAQRLHAALAARKHMLVIGRTDAVTLFGVDEAIRRCRRMADCGVDAVMVPSLSTLEDIEKVARSCPVPVLHTVAETVRPLHSQAELESTGLGMVLYSITLIQASVFLQRAILSELRRNGSTAGFVNGMTPLAELSALLGAGRYADFESEILGKAR